MGNKKL